MNEFEIVHAMIKAFNATGIPYMIVGSLSTNVYGIERSTKDADFVVQLGSFPLAKLMAQLPPEFRLESQIGFETITSTTRYRLHCQRSTTPFMIELFEVGDDPHDKMRFSRRVEASYGGEKTFLPRPEDAVITKLRWSLARPGSGKDIDDVRNVLAVQQGKLDMPYIRDWCGKHGTLEILEKLLATLPVL